MNASNYFKAVDPKIEYGLGFEYLLSESMGLKIYGGHNLVLSDKLDGIESGKRDDFYWRFGLGVNYYLTKSTKSKSKDGLSRKEQRLKYKLERRQQKELKKTK